MEKSEEQRVKNPIVGTSGFSVFHSSLFIYFFLYSVGETPMDCLKQRLKYLGSEKPQW